MAILTIVSLATPSIAQKATKKVSQADSRIESNRLYDEQLKRANKGLPEEQFTLGLMFATGIGVSKDLKQAARWYQRAAEAGHANAQYHLGSAYLAGAGTQKDPYKAVVWWRKAAQAGHAAAQLTLGQALTYGLGVEADQVEGRKWVESAAAQGDPQAFTFLSQIKPVLSTDTAASADTDAHKNMQLSHSSLPSVEIKPRAADAPKDKGSTHIRPEAHVTSIDGTGNNSPLLASQGTSAKRDTTIAAVDSNRQPSRLLSQKVAKTIVPATTQTQPLPRGGNDNAWLYTQDPDHYSVQLVSADSKVAAQRYIESQGLGNQATYFHTRVKGKDWYYVLYGSFATREEAETAGQRITKSAWIRRFGVLQKKRCAGAAQLPPQQSLEVTLFCEQSG